MQLLFEIFVINTAEKKLIAHHKSGSGANNLKLLDIIGN